MKITASLSHGVSRRLEKGKAPAYVPSDTSTASLSDAAPPAHPPPAQEQRPVVQQQVTPPKRQQQREATPSKQAKAGHQKSVPLGVSAGAAASGMGMDLPPTAAFAAPRIKPRTNQFVKDTSFPSSDSPLASQQVPGAAFVYGGSGFHFGVVGTLLTLAIVGLTSSSMKAGGPSSAGTRLSDASPLSVWADSPLGPPPSLIDPLSPGATLEPVRPVVRNRWAPRSDAGPDDELCKTAAVQPRAHLRVAALDLHYRLAAPERTRFYDPPAMFTPPTSSFVNPEDAEPAVVRPRRVLAVARTDERRAKLDVAAQHGVDEVARLVVARARDDGRARLGGPRRLCASFVDVNLGVGGGQPPGRPPRATPVKVEPPPLAAAIEPPRLDFYLEAPALEQQPQPVPREQKARSKTRMLTILWTELWQEVHSAQSALPPSPDVPSVAG